MNYNNKHSRGNHQKGGFGRRDRFNSNGTNFKTRCADCGNDCTVPFRPNGRKPVLCSDCFQGNSSRPKRFESRSSKPSRFSRSSNDEDLKTEFKKLHRKLDRILDILQEVQIEEVEE